tara:strand:+ start:138541 stop:138948 length:408 start_codon:yes stop_codon:yes gene_type:complete
MKMTEGDFVLAWVIPKGDFESTCWIMVKHCERGWELPGGKLNENEAIEIGALREVWEETGLLGTAVAIESELIEKGHVVLIKVDVEPDPYGWNSDDSRIDEVGWCVELPADLHWGEEEITRILNHDWSKSRILSS